MSGKAKGSTYVTHKNNFITHNTLMAIHNTQKNQHYFVCYEDLFVCLKVILIILCPHKLIILLMGVSLKHPNALFRHCLDRFHGNFRNKIRHVKLLQVYSFFSSRFKKGYLVGSVLWWMLKRGCECFGLLPYCEYSYSFTIL